MAKKKVVKKSASKSKSSKKVIRRVSKPVKKSSKIRRSSKNNKGAGTMEVVKPPMVDVTTEVKKDVVEVKPEPAAQQPQNNPPVEKHDEFAKALTQEPKKKGFWARLFGRD